MSVPGANGRPAIWDRTRIQNTMWAGVGVLRDGDGLRQAIDQLGTGLALADADATEPAATACEPDPITRLENRNLLTVGYVEANAALRRTESRGAHARTDYPESCDEWAQSIAYIKRLALFAHLSVGAGLSLHAAGVVSVP